MTVFDPSLVEEAFEDDKEGLAQFLRTVCTSIRRGLERVRKAIEAADAPELRQAAHALKGSSGHIGGEEVSAIAHRVEMAAKDGKIESPAVLGELEVAIGRLEAQIDVYERKLLAAG